MFHTFVCYLHVHCFVNQKLNIKLIWFVEVYSEINSNLLDEKFYFFNSRSIESILRRLVGQQITNQTSLKLLYVIYFLAKNLVKKKFKYLNFKFRTLSYIFLQSSFV